MMRLLKRLPSGDLELESFNADPPPYAILSHTWIEGQEVLYDDLTAGTGIEKTGYNKLRFCGERAAQDGLHYFWVDTCCINKRSESELSSAINSMFRWYKEAARCYVFLSDVVLPHNAPDLQLYHITWKNAFRKSRWFTRGWTLQELIAPPIVEFFSENGQALGNRISLEQDIHEVTQIPVQVLRGSRLSDFSVDERMSWAARRKTTINEDQVYCLFGIFGVFMPLIYGEGETNARFRLEKEVQQRRERQGIKSSRDLPEDRGDREESNVSRSSDLTQPLTYGRSRSLISSEPVLDIPTREIGLIFARLPEVQHVEIAEIIATNCKIAAFEFYDENALWRTRFSPEDKRNDPKLFELANGRFPQNPEDLPLRSWIRKIQHACSVQRVNHPDGVSAKAIRDLFSKDGYHFSEALNILKMLDPWKLLNDLEFESSLCYAISWCRHLYASDCEARLNSLWVELHPSDIDDNWQLNLDRARVPHSYPNI